jgi:RND superfamily putative drug exporter
VLVSVPLAGSGTDETSAHALQTLRENVIPHTVGSIAGVDTAVTGPTAASEDLKALCGWHHLDGVDDDLLPRAGGA